MRDTGAQEDSLGLSEGSRSVLFSPSQRVMYLNVLAMTHLEQTKQHESHWTEQAQET